MIYKEKFTSGAAVPGLPGYTVQHEISTTFQGEPLKVVIAKKLSPPTIIVCFQGTTTSGQLLQQVKSGVAQPWRHLNVKGKKMKVMKYYWEAVDILDVSLTVESRNDTKYLFTGHSLGGGLASLFAVAMVTINDGDAWKHSGTRLITFGQPRIGDKSFAEYHDNLIPPFKKLRLVFNKDIVPHLPYRLQSFLHASTEIWIQTTYVRHIKWCYNRIPCGVTRSRNDTWKVCPEGDDAHACSNGIRTLGVLPVFSVKDHAMKNYVDAVARLIKDKGKADRFVQEKCEMDKEKKGGNGKSKISYFMKVSDVRLPPFNAP